MQNKKIIKFFTVTAIFSIVFVAIRAFLLFATFDFKSKFFENNLPVTLFYFSLIVFSAIMYISRKKYSIKTNMNIKKSKFFFNPILTALFIVLICIGLKNNAELTLLENITMYISIFSGAFSVLFYIVSMFSNESFIWVLNTAPAIYFICMTVSDFIQQTGHANTYNDFSHILSLIALSFLIIEEGKAFVSKNYSLLFPVYFICSTLIAQSVIPDLITAGMNEITLKAIILITIKITYLTFTIIKLLTLIKNACEDKK